MTNQTEVFTEKQVEIHRKTQSIYDRLSLIESLSTVLELGITSEYLQILTPEQLAHYTGHIGKMSHHIGEIAQQTANDFDSLSMEEITDIEAARRL